MSAAAVYLVVSLVLGLRDPHPATAPCPLPSSTPDANGLTGSTGSSSTTTSTPADQEQPPAKEVGPEDVELLLQHQLTTMFRLAQSADAFHQADQPFLRPEAGCTCDLTFTDSAGGEAARDAPAAAMMATIDYPFKTLSWAQRSDRNGVRVSTAKLPDNQWEVVVGERVIAGVTAAQLTAFLNDDTCRLKYDRNFGGSEHMATWSTQMSATTNAETPAPLAPASCPEPAPHRVALTTMSYRGQWPVCDRRFVVISGHCRLTRRQPGQPDQPDVCGALVATRSVRRTFLERAGQSAGSTASEVAGQLHIAGFRVLPLPESMEAPGVPRCHLTMVNHVDFGGNMPAGLINYVQTTITPEILNLIQQHAVKYSQVGA